MFIFEFIIIYRGKHFGIQRLYISIGHIFIVRVFMVFKYRIYIQALIFSVYRRSACKYVVFAVFIRKVRITQIITVTLSHGKVLFEFTCDCYNVRKVFFLDKEFCFFNEFSIFCYFVNRRNSGDASGFNRNDMRSFCTEYRNSLMKICHYRYRFHIVLDSGKVQLFIFRIYRFISWQKRSRRENLSAFYFAFYPIFKIVQTVIASFVL